jgi:hypothetical protein
MTEYDSRVDTHAHIAVVRGYLLQVAVDLMYRGNDHDLSKLGEPELHYFDEYTPKLKESTYDSDEYHTFLSEMSPALTHHYEVNDHHPEHFDAGIHGMDLVQLIEMLADWKAATLRHNDGDLRRSIALNMDRFGYGTELYKILMKTAENLGWLD